jgi:hypothetical protein
MADNLTLKGVRDRNRVDLMADIIRSDRIALLAGAHPLAAFARIVVEIERQPAR